VIATRVELSTLAQGNRPTQYQNLLLVESKSQPDLSRKASFFDPVVPAADRPSWHPGLQRIVGLYRSLHLPRGQHQQLNKQLRLDQLLNLSQILPRPINVPRLRRLQGRLPRLLQPQPPDPRRRRFCMTSTATTAVCFRLKQANSSRSCLRKEMVRHSPLLYVYMSRLTVFRLVAMHEPRYVSSRLDPRSVPRGASCPRTATYSSPSSASSSTIKPCPRERISHRRGSKS
jgi:hypothetical protein